MWETTSENNITSIHRVRIESSHQENEQTTIVTAVYTVCYMNEWRVITRAPGRRANNDPGAGSRLQSLRVILVEIVEKLVGAES